jgi:hypothetical protein
MYEHVGFAERVVTLVARWAATVTALVLVFLGWPRGLPPEWSTPDTTVGLPTDADLDEPTGQHIATCRAYAAEQDSLRRVRLHRGLAK